MNNIDEDTQPSQIFWKIHRERYGNKDMNSLLHSLF